MKWVSYAWSTAMGLFTLVIAFAVVFRFDSPFERVVVDLLVMIYVAVQSGTQVQGFIALDKGRVERTRFLAVMKASGKDLENEETRQEIRDEDERLGRQSVKGYISAVFTFLIFLLAALNLLGALQR